MHVRKIWDNDLTEYQVWYKSTEIWKAFGQFLTANRKPFSCLEFVFEKGKHREAGLKHKLTL